MSDRKIINELPELKGQTIKRVYVEEIKHPSGSTFQLCIRLDDGFFVLTASRLNYNGWAGAVPSFHFTTDSQE